MNVQGILDPFLQNYVLYKMGQDFLGILYSYLQTKVAFSFANSTVCPSITDVFYIVSQYINWVTTSWTYSVPKNYYTESTRNLDPLLQLILYKMCQDFLGIFYSYIQTKTRTNCPYGEDFLGTQYIYITYLHLGEEQDFLDIQ